MFKMFKKKFKKKDESIWKSFDYAIDGLKTCLNTERNLIIHFTAMILVTIAAFVFKITLPEWIVCIILFGLVISAELFNTAIETTIDICSPEINPKAKLAKDTAAAAVLVLAIASSIIGIIIFLPHVVDFLNNLCR